MPSARVVGIAHETLALYDTGAVVVVVLLGLVVALVEVVVLPVLVVAPLVPVLVVVPEIVVVPEVDVEVVDVVPELVLAVVVLLITGHHHLRFKRSAAVPPAQVEVLE